ADHRFVAQRAGLERVAGPLAPHHGVGHLPQLAVNRARQPLLGLGVAGARRHEHRRERLGGILRHRRIPLELRKSVKGTRGYSRTFSWCRIATRDQPQERIMLDKQDFMPRDRLAFPRAVAPETAASNERPTVRARLVDGITVVEVLDAETLFTAEAIADLTAQLRRLVEAGHTRMVLDFRGVRS